MLSFLKSVGNEHRSVRRCVLVILAPSSQVTVYL